MGRKKSIIRQVSERFYKMAAFGESKHAAKLENGGKPPKDKIYSHSTMENYRDVGITFAKWARDTHNCKDIEQARQHVPEYLTQRINGGKSAWTIHRDAAALSKLYQCCASDFGVKLPKRQRENVTQHRTNASKGHFSESKHADLVELCKATGLRRHEVQQLRPEDVKQTSDGRTLVHVRQGKGGKERVVTALNDSPARIARQAAIEGRQTVVDVPKYAPVHEYRADYANTLYARLCRDTGALNRSEVYVCQRDKAGTVYDRSAMKAVSVSMGHARLDVVTNYLR